MFSEKLRFQWWEAVWYKRLEQNETKNPGLWCEDAWVSFLFSVNFYWLSPTCEASPVAQLVKNLPAMRETWVGKIPWRRERLPTPVFWPGEFLGVAKSRTWLSDFHFCFHMWGTCHLNLCEPQSLGQKLRWNIYFSWFLLWGRCNNVWEKHNVIWKSLLLLQWLLHLGWETSMN